MRKKLVFFLTVFIFPLLLITTFANWIIVAEKSATVGKEIATKAVCYNDTTGTEYTRIEAALENASNGQTIYVIPGLKDSSNENSYEIRINKNCEIKTGVTLCLPYDGTTYYSESSWGSKQVFADSTDANIKTYRKTKVVISEGVTLTINNGAYLQIGGVFGYQGSHITGIVNGNYCEIALEENASIVSYGIIDCYGFIKEADYLNNGSILEIKRGKINFPLMIYDYQGGANTLEMYSSANVFPFDLFDIANIQTLLRVHSGASAIAEYRLYMQSEQFRGKINFISSATSNTLLVLTSGYLDFKYTPSKIGYTTISVVEGQTIVTLDGAMSLGSVQIDVKYIFTITMDSSNYHFPISYKFKFVIEDGATMIVGNKVKFLQGSTLHIKSGGVAQISNEVVFLPSYDTTGLTTGKVAYTYPITSTGAQFINDGYLLIDEAGSLGADVTTTTDNAILDVSTEDYDVYISLYAENYDTSKTVSLTGILYGNSSSSSLSNKVYVSQNDNTWIEFKEKFTLDYYKVYTDANDKFVNSSTFTGHNEETTALNITDERTLDTYSADGSYNFVGWFFDEECTQRINDNMVYASQLLNYDIDGDRIVEVYAKFTMAPLIDVIYYGSVSNGTYDETAKIDGVDSIAGETIKLNSALADYYIIKTTTVGASKGLSNDEKEWYTFNAWNINLKYKDGTELSVIGYAESEYTIPEDYDGTSIEIVPAFKYISSEYKLSYSKSIGTLASVAGVSATVTKGSDELSTGDIWVSSGETITITGKGINKWYGSYSIKCSITGVSNFISGSNYVNSNETGSVTIQFTIPENGVVISITSS